MGRLMQLPGLLLPLILGDAILEREQLANGQRILRAPLRDLAVAMDAVGIELGIEDGFDPFDARQVIGHGVLGGDGKRAGQRRLLATIAREAFGGLR